MSGGAPSSGCRWLSEPNEMGLAKVSERKGRTPRFSGDFPAEAGRSGEGFTFVSNQATAGGGGITLLNTMASRCDALLLATGAGSYVLFVDGDQAGGGDRNCVALHRLRGLSSQCPAAWFLGQ